MLKILIPNATGPSNIGDQAILLPVLRILKKRYPGSNLSLHSTSPNLYPKDAANRIDSHLYSWAVLENKNPLERAKRMFFLGLSYLRFPLVNNSKLNGLIRDYLDSDLILFAGGGYFRSQKGITQTLNLLMIATMFNFAKLSKAKKIVAPTSFGPFAYEWQERYIANILKDFDIVALREHTSFDLLNKYKLKNLILSTDAALFLEISSKRNKNKNFVLGFTIRNWLNKKDQKKFENNFLKAITNFSKSAKASIQPIVQVNAPEYGDFDSEITERLFFKLRKSGVKVLKIKRIMDLEKSVSVYSRIDLLLGMRMHSNILAAIQGTPFVAISYEHKTEGIAKDLGVEEYCIKVEEVNEENLYNLLMKAYTNKAKIKKTLNSSIKKIKVKETQKWDKIFQSVL